MPIDNEVVRAVERYQLVRPPINNEYLFLSSRHNQLSDRGARQALKGAAIRAGVMDEGESRFHKKFTPHTYRTVFTTLMRNQGMSDHILKYIRGDANQETMDIYTRVDRSQAREEYLRCIKPISR